MDVIYHKMRNSHIAFPHCDVIFVNVQPLDIGSKKKNPTESLGQLTARTKVSYTLYTLIGLVLYKYDTSIHVSFSLMQCILITK